MNFNEKSILLLGDAHPSIVKTSLANLGYSKEKKLKVEFMKVSHHASNGNTDDDLLDMIDCSNFIISTDGSKHGLPTKEVLARIIYRFKGCNLFFNYQNKITESIFSDEEKTTYGFNCVYLNKTNYIISL